MKILDSAAHAVKPEPANTPINGQVPSQTSTTADLVDIRTPVDQLEEIRDWHLSKASVAWSFETRDRHESFAAWLDDTIKTLSAE